MTPPEVYDTFERVTMPLYREETAETNESMDIDEPHLPGSPDMFPSETEIMEDDMVLTREEKDYIIKESVEKLNDKMINTENELPDFVRNSRFY